MNPKKHAIVPDAENHFLFIANDVPRSPSERVSAEQIAATLLERGLWAFSESAPLRAKLVPGNEVLIYLAGQGRRHFVASAVLSSEAAVPEGEVKALLTRLGLTFLRHVVRLRDVCPVSPPVPILPLVPELHFITDKHNYGLHLRLPIVWISKEDFGRILGGAGTRVQDSTATKADRTE